MVAKSQQPDGASRATSLAERHFQQRNASVWHTLFLAFKSRRCGLAEAPKHGLIADEERVDWIVTHAEALRDESQHRLAQTQP